ncbi:MAG: head-tail connector protein [Rickettsiaceae bacterium]|nr:head-tail connector protein [Rickettsiaceae bacterium]MDP4832154.1 head-tail connector protein [Rickettsiaceae bacterium]MDP5020350.1 head-tail connector protein [Rickettsiaceae bacterium]MDP5082842.1 head-tail connector protein [Rickettsiaceae bacterium]
MIINHVVSNIKNVEIWPLEEVKNYLRISHEYDDKLIADLTATAIDAAELFTRLSFHIKQVNCKAIGVSDVIRLKYIPILEIGEIYLLERGAKTNITNDFGYVHTDNTCLSIASSYIGKDIEIEYKTGYRDNIPRSIQHGILMHIAAMYENAESAAILSTQIKDLYIPYREIKI